MPVQVTAADALSRQDVGLKCVKLLRDEICKHLLSENKQDAQRMQELLCDESCIVIQNLTFAYPTRVTPRSHNEPTMGPNIFTDFSYEFKTGVSYNIEGFGGSTLLRLIAEALTPSSGLISVPLNFKRVMVHRIPDILEGTLVSNVMAVASSKYTETHAKQLMRMMGFDKSLIDEPVHLVSGGRNLKWAEQKLVALARAIMRDPAVLCTYRPSEGLSTRVALKVESVIKDWRAGVLKGFEGRSQQRTVFAVGLGNKDFVKVVLPPCIEENDDE